MATYLAGSPGGPLNHQISSRRMERSLSALKKDKHFRRRLSFLSFRFWLMIGLGPVSATTVWPIFLEFLGVGLSADLWASPSCLSASLAMSACVLHHRLAGSPLPCDPQSWVWAECACRVLLLPPESSLIVRKSHEEIKRPYFGSADARTGGVFDGSA